MNHLTQTTDFNVETIEKIITLAFDYQKKHQLGIRRENVLDGKVVAMIFEKPSLRTKVAFEMAAEGLGGTAVYLNHAQILASGGQEQGRESIPDIARNLERFSDLILARVYDHGTIQTIVKHVQKPVINALCDRHHPTQSLADLMAIKWHKEKELQQGKTLSVTYLGDGNNVAASLAQICLMSGINFNFCGPDGYQLDESYLTNLSAQAEFQIIADPSEAVSKADVIYTDTYISMGEENKRDEKLDAFMPYQVNKKLFDKAPSDTIFMHCLPAHRGEEVTDEIMDHERSIVFDQAECRMHIAKALLHHFLS